MIANLVIIFFVFVMKFTNMVATSAAKKGNAVLLKKSSAATSKTRRGLLATFMRNSCALRLVIIYLTDSLFRLNS